jgi:hypothetical protein
MPTISIRLNDIEVALLDEEARAEGLTRSDVLRNALLSHRAWNGARQRSLERFASRLIARFGEDAVLTLRVTDGFDAEALIAGEPVDIYAMAAADVGDTIQLIVGDETSDARARVGIVPMRSGAQASIPLRMLSSVGVLDLHED